MTVIPISLQAQLKNPVQYPFKMSANNEIILSVEGKIATITLNLPKKLNALTQDLYYKLAQTMRKIAMMDNIYITILTGKGRYFSAYVSIPWAAYVLTKSVVRM